MSGVVTRAQEAASQHRNKRVRLASSTCRWNNTYARAVDILEIQLSKRDFIAVIDHIATILRHTEDINVLILRVDRLPRMWQARLLGPIYLPHLWSFTISSSSKQYLQPFLDRHRKTITHLRYDDCNRHSPMELVTQLPPLSLASIVGPIDSVAEILPHCVQHHLAIVLSGETRASHLQKHDGVFQPHLVTDLTLTLRPQDYDVLQKLSTYFHNLDRLKVIAKDHCSVHVWSNVKTWVRILQSLSGASRLVLETSQAISVHRLPVLGAGTTGPESGAM
ncbi:hypothetical protein K523DRAFT_356695 [Schizophyllum commune Tattone D]|nr:hypothetical protein K523DRAFT_356695 [Schizophyllum commune Tattone D]